MGAPVVHFEINAKDSKRTQEFYSNLLGWTINSNNPMGYGLVDTGVKTGISGGITQKQGNIPAGPTFYAQVADPQSYLDRAVSMGASVVLPVTVMPNMATYAIFADPEGNVVGLVKGPQTVQKTARTRTTTTRRKTTTSARTRGRKTRSRR